VVSVVGYYFNPRFANSSIRFHARCFAAGLRVTKKKMAVTRLSSRNRPEFELGICLLVLSGAGAGRLADYQIERSIFLQSKISALQ